MADAAAGRAPQRAGLVLAALILVAAVANLNLAVANVALPDIGKAFDSSQTTLDLIAVGYSLGLAASVLYLGAVGDRYGRKLDLAVAGRRIFWVAAVAGIIVFGTLMGAMFIGQQFLQNVLGYSTFEAGLSILPAAVLMVLVAPRSAKLVEAQGSRVTLLTGYACCLLGFVAMLLFWNDGISYWAVGLAYALVGGGVGFAGTPASHSLTGSVPVHRAGMASGTADLQRDLGGAIMQSILGALLAAGYAAAVSTAISDAPNRQEITDSVQNQLVKSFSSAEATAEQYPQYADAITAAAKTSFIDGADWAYVAGIIAILIGATLVYLLFPRKDAEQQLLTKYHAEDSQRARARMSASAAPPVGHEDTGLGTS